uniref:Uncharacterized protein n=2 Tax=Oryza sativa subsp. japonica TaxID=39947 RepID=Q69QV6_ORYSJ|nr:hypothetical protein [Oryza sativa Japonica Group]BAD30967.1 hypothetical protein [Oryza sativa Japonica Group]BAD31302.1 hypothetical protein [Oryza sativa Japonica Group]
MARRRMSRDDAAKQMTLRACVTLPPKPRPEFLLPPELLLKIVARSDATTLVCSQTDDATEEADKAAKAGNTDGDGGGGQGGEAGGGIASFRLAVIFPPNVSQSLSSLDRYGHGNSDMKLQKEGDRRLVLGLFLEAFGIDLCICMLTHVFLSVFSLVKRETEQHAYMGVMLRNEDDGSDMQVENGIKVNRSLAIRLAIDELELVVGYTIKLALIEMGQCRMDNAPTAAANRRVHEIAYRFRDADKADGEEIDSSMLCGLEFLFSNNWRPIRFTETVAYAPNYACSFSHLLQQLLRMSIAFFYWEKIFSLAVLLRVRLRKAKIDFHKRFS